MSRIDAILPGPLWLPPPIGRRIDAMADTLLQPPGMAFDFRSPAGEAALVPPDSISWRIFKNPVALFVGGVAAVLLELAEPRVRDGVWQHSSFRTDALKRLQRTGLAAMVTVYGARSRAEAMIAGVVRAHGAVTGTTSEGVPYQANDPELLVWVQATAGFGFIGAYDALVRPLDRAAWDRALAEAEPAARLYGAIGTPRSKADLDALFARMDATLVPSPIIAEFLDIMARVEAFPGGARPLQRILLKAAASLLPPHLRIRLGLAAWTLSPWERAAAKLAARISDRIVLKTAPPAQACLRLGLPIDYLYRTRPGDGPRTASPRSPRLT